MFNSVETLVITIVDDVRARKYNYISKTDNQRKEGVSLSAFGLIFNESKNVNVPCVVSLRNVNESHEIKAGQYSLEAPSSYFKRTLVAGIPVFSISFSVDSEKVIFKPLKVK